MNAPIRQTEIFSAGRRVRDPDAKRLAVLTAAAQAFVNDGYGATSIDDIAAALGVTKPTIYYYAGAKQALLEGCFSIALDAYSAAVDETVLTGATARDRLHQVITAYVGITTTVFGRCLHRVPDTELTQDVRERLRMVKRKVDARIRDLLRAGVQDGSLRTLDARMSTFAISGAMNAIAQWYDPAGPLSPDRIAALMWDNLFEGLRPASDA
ncbi:TetR family transcriptional regulator [Rhizobium sp. CRIBSB]|nr:TetR family transcriptional regulator [Rhizobium sp. CRIBSB]